MKIKLNPAAATARADFKRMKIQNVCAGSSETRLPTPILKASATVCSIIRKNSKSNRSLGCFLQFIARKRL